MKDQIYNYLLLLGDNALILGHRLSELCGHGPSLETDIALTNISLDFFGQVRNYYQYAAKLKGEDSSEDSIAFLRNERSYYNCILVEQENKDFAYVIVRQFLFDSFHHLLLSELISSRDEQIAAIARKSVKESSYHLRFSSEWIKRIGSGTKESAEKTQRALNDLYPYVHELFIETSVEKLLKEEGIAADITLIKPNYYTNIQAVITEAKLTVPEAPERYANGKNGVHSELLGHLLSELQYMQRAYPGMEW